MSDGEIVLHNTEDGEAEIQLRTADEIVWPSQVEIAKLFQTTTQNISLHVCNILADGELDPESTVKEYLTAQTEGKRQFKCPVTSYQLKRKDAQSCAAPETDDLEELKRIVDAAKERKKGGSDA